MEELQSEIAKVRELLGSHPEGLSITDIAGSLQMNRNSVSKYMDILQIQGAVDGRKRGTSKVYYHSQRLLASSVLKVCTRPLVIIDQENMVIDLNQPFLEVLSVSRDHVLKQPFEALPLKILEGGTAQQVLRAAQKGTEQRVRIQMFSKEKTSPATLLLIPVVFENGKPGVSAIIDIAGTVSEGPETDRFTDEIANLLDNQIEYVVRHTPEGIIQYVNEPYCRATGKAREDLIGRPFKPIVSVEDAERIRVHFSRLTKQYPAGMIDYRTIMANGEAVWQHWWDRALLNDRDEIAGFVSCGIDITSLVDTQQKLKKTKDTLEESIKSRTDELREINQQLYAEMTRREKLEQQLLQSQFAMDNAADMVFWVNRNARIHYANSASIVSSGYSPDLVVTLTVGEIFPYYSITQWDKAWEQLKHTGVITKETTLLREDGSQVPVEVSFKYLEYHGNEFAFCFARDIAERNRMERALQLANKRLNIISSITRHDIQNKITVLLGFLGRAKRMETNPVILEYMNRQELAANSIRSGINMTRDFKDAGTEPPVWSGIRGLISAAKESLHETPVSITEDIPDIEMYADSHIDRVFSRLFENVLRLDPGTQEIRVSTRKADDDILINIESDGPGVLPGEKEDLFLQEKDGTRVQGLFIARELLSLTGITLDENGVYGKGTRFEIRIPAGYYRSAQQKEA
jgi:PAS domain S-box-containing protein